MRYKVVVVDINFTVLGTTSWKRAIKLILSDKAHLIKFDENIILYKNKDKDVTIFLPRLIQLKTVMKYLWGNKISCTRKNIMRRDAFTCVY